MPITRTTTLLPALATPPVVPRLLRAGVVETTLVRHLDEPLLGGNRVAVLDDPAAALATFAEAVDAARDHVNIEGDVFGDGGPDGPLLARLAARCRAGVRVNLLQGAGPVVPWHAALRAAGARIGAGVDASRWWPRPAVAPARRGLLVVDGRLAFVGGGTLLPLRIEGPAVQRLQRVFIRHWQQQACCGLPEARYYPPLPVTGTQRVAVAAQEAARRRRPFPPFSEAAAGPLPVALDAARHRVVLTSAQRTLPRRVAQALARAAERGVRVERLPAAPQHPEACVIDGFWASVGAGHVPGDADVVVLDEGFACSVEDALRRAGPAVAAGQPAPWRRAAESLARRFELRL